MFGLGTQEIIFIVLVVLLFFPCFNYIFLRVCALFCYIFPHLFSWQIYKNPTLESWIELKRGEGAYLGCCSAAMAGCASAESKQALPLHSACTAVRD